MKKGGIKFPLYCNPADLFMEYLSLKPGMKKHNLNIFTEEIYSSNLADFI